MAYRLEFHPEAEAEFDEAITWYQEQRDGLAHEFFDDYLVLESRLEENPGQFPVVLDNIRRANFHRFPTLFSLNSTRTLFSSTPYSIKAETRKAGKNGCDQQRLPRGLRNDEYLSGEVFRPGQISRQPLPAFSIGKKSTNTNKSIKILRSNQSRFAVWVGLQKGFWETRRFSGLPLEFEGV